MKLSAKSYDCIYLAVLRSIQYFHQILKVSNPTSALDSDLNFATYPPFSETTGKVLTKVTQGSRGVSGAKTQGCQFGFGFLRLDRRIETQRVSYRDPGIEGEVFKLNNNNSKASFIEGY